MILLIQGAVPAYRVPVFEELAERIRDLVVAHGEAHFNGTVRSVPAGRYGSARVVNRYLLGGRIAWQGGALAHARSAAAVVAELNPRNITTWLLLVRRGTPVVLWGHAWSRSGPAAWSNVLRRVMRRLCAAVVVYTREEHEALRHESRPVFVASNGLYRQGWLRNRVIPAIRSSPAPPRGTFIVSSRLVREKRVDLAIRAVARADVSGRRLSLTIVGDGPDHSRLAALAHDLGVSDRVTFAGTMFDPDELLDTYLQAAVAIVPGYAGLALIQALSFGRPAIVADDEPHAPEVEAARHPGACRWFAAGDPSSLADAMIAMTEDPPEVQRSTQLAEWAASTYTVETVVAGLQEAVQSVRPRPPMTPADPSARPERW